jgi:hypothetical protein
VALSGKLSFQQKPGYYHVERPGRRTIGLQPTHEFFEALRFNSGENFILLGLSLTFSKPTFELEEFLVLKVRD